MNVTKDYLRNKYLSMRNELNKKKSDKFSENIIKKAINLIKKNKLSSIHCYLSIKNEVKTDKLFEYFKDVKIYVPVTKKKELKTALFQGRKNLIRKKFEILEPKNPIIEDVEPDVIIVPGIVFDLKGNRIGYGKGYYDCFLSNKTGIKIGLCYDFQLYNSIPNEKHDIKMDIIITENRIIKV